jgi:uncharacterized protein
MSEQTSRFRLRRFLVILAGTYLSILLLLRIFESHLIFFPDFPSRLAGDWRPSGLPIEDVWISADDGIKLHAWWIPAENSKFTFLAFHGNAGNISDRAYVDRFLHELPVNVLAVEYRGYGKSEGQPSEKYFYRDARSALRYLQEKRGIDPQTIISYGQSLGTAIATDLASESKVGGLVLEAPFPSIASMARRAYWFLPGLSLLVGSQFDTKSKIENVKVPLLIVQCASDPVIPPDLGQQVYAAAPSPKTLLKFDMSCHEESALLAPTRYKVGLLAFFAKIDQR